MRTYTGLNDMAGGKIFCYSESEKGPNPNNICEISDVLLIREIKQDLILEEEECNIRGLLNSKKWLSEMLFCLCHVPVGDDVYPPALNNRLKDELYVYKVAKAFFDLKEYDRAAFFTEHSSTPEVRFLHFYSRYLSGEKKMNEDSIDLLSSPDQYSAPYLKELHSELSMLYSDTQNKGQDDTFDGYLLWLYGIILKKLDMQRQAVDVLCQAISKTPNHWGAWLELSTLIFEKEEIQSLILPSHWMKRFFIAHVFHELYVTDEAMAIYIELEKLGIKNSSYIKAQKAIAFHNQKDIDNSISLFKEIENDDPFRLENMDMFSNLLFVREMRIELSHLAHRVVLIDKYRVETCCVVGNYYSLKGQHEKAVQYFQRALRLNHQYLAGWTLMGHEYMEMKNTNAAIQCYRQAIEVDRREYRAWYGLGQTYEILKLPAYCIYYYKQAQRLHPHDSRTLVALGDSYEKLERWQEAKKCYHKAHSVGDIEDLALLRLARLYAKLGDGERSAVVYERFLQETEGPSEDRGQAYLFLAEHFLQKNILDLANEYAHQCTLFPETRESGKTVLNEIANRRHQSNLNADVPGCGSIFLQRPPGKDGDCPAGRLPPLNLAFSP